MRLLLKWIVGGLFLVIISSCEPKVEKVVEKEIVVEDTISTVLNAFDSTQANVIEAYFDEKYAKKEFNGVILFATNGKPIYKKAYGFEDFKSNDTLTLNSQFQLASVSKPITALAILQLQEKGLIDFQDDIRKYIPELPYEGITVDMLLTHKSGLFNYMYFCDRFWGSWVKPISNEETIELICKKEPDIWYLPGRKYNYSNTGYMLLASIVERVSGQSFVHYMEDHIFKPLEMSSTHIFDACLSPGIKKDGVKGYRPNRRIAEESYLDGVVGDKGVYSTVLDLFKLDQALYTNKVVSSKTLDIAFTPMHERLHIDDNYGYGWRIDASDPEYKVVYHAGWWKGFRSHFIRILPNKATIIVLTNHQRCYLPRKELMSLIGY